jgi:purine nucleoside permease
MISCHPTDLAVAAKSFQGLAANEKQAWAVRTYLLALIAGVDPDPEALATAAKCFQCYSDQQHKQVQDFLLCQIVNR